LTPRARTGASPPTTGRRWPKMDTPGEGGTGVPARVARLPSCSGGLHRPPSGMERCCDTALLGPLPPVACPAPASLPTTHMLHSFIALLSGLPPPRRPLPHCRWKRRLGHMAQYFSAYRIDHILGFCRIWEVPGDCATGGVPGPWVLSVGGVDAYKLWCCFGRQGACIQEGTSVAATGMRLHTPNKVPVMTWMVNCMGGSLTPKCRRFQSAAH
jgi:hypothetical protein